MLPGLWPNPATDDTLMTAPEARGTMAASAARVSRMVAITCNRCMRSCPSSGVSQNRPMVPKPALLTRSCNSGADAMRASTRARSVSSVKSAGNVSAPPSSRASFSSKSGRRATRISWKPSRARRRANSSPIPLEAPVTIATRRVLCISVPVYARHPMDHAKKGELRSPGKLKHAPPMLRGRRCD